MSEKANTAVTNNNNNKKKLSAAHTHTKKLLQEVAIQLKTGSWLHEASTNVYHKFLSNPSGSVLPYFHVSDICYTNKPSRE